MIFGIFKKKENKQPTPEKPNLKHRAVKRTWSDGNVTYHVEEYWDHSDSWQPWGLTTYRDEQWVKDLVDDLNTPLPIVVSQEVL